MSSVFYNIYSNTSPFITNFNISSAVTANASNNTVINFINPYSSTGNANPFPAVQPPPNTSPIPAPVVPYLRSIPDLSQDRPSPTPGT